MNSVISNLKKYVFPFIMMTTLLIFGIQSFSNVLHAEGDRVITINDPKEIANVSIKDKSIIKLGKNITSFDLSTLPKVENKTRIVIETENESDRVTLNNKLLEKYEFSLMIPHGDVEISDQSYNPSSYYISKGTEKNPDILILNVSNFDLSLLPDQSDNRYLAIVDQCETEGIDFGDSVLPKNYVVSKIFVLNEKDKQTFKVAFPKAEISLIKKEELYYKVMELFYTDDTTTSDKEQPATPENTPSDKKTGEEVFYIYLFEGCFLICSTISLAFLLNKRKFN